jgi:hypothetical protein
MTDDPVVGALAVAFGIALGWLIISTLWQFSRGFRKATRWVTCKFGFHAPSGSFVPAVGGRDVDRCMYCDHVVFEIKRTKGSLRRTNNGSRS